MNLEKRELFLAQQGLTLLVAEMEGMIEKCPNPQKFSDVLSVMDKELAEILALRTTIRKELGLDG